MKNIKYYQEINSSKNNFELVINFLKIISEPNRLKILCFLRFEEKCVCEIWKHLDLPQNLISHHLKILKDFDLIKSKQEGRKIIYCSNKQILQTYNSFLNTFFIANL